MKRECIELSQRALDAIETIKQRYNLKSASSAVIMAINETKIITPGLPEVPGVKMFFYRPSESELQKVTDWAEKHNTSKRQIIESALYAFSLTHDISYRCKFAPGQEVWYWFKAPLLRKVLSIDINVSKDGVYQYLYLNNESREFDPDELFSTKEECEAANNA